MLMYNANGRVYMRRWLAYLLGLIMITDIVLLIYTIVLVVSHIAHAETINLNDAWKACVDMASYYLDFDETRNLNAVYFDDFEMTDWNYKYVWDDAQIAKDCQTVQEMIAKREIADKDARMEKLRQEYQAEKNKKVSTYKPLIEQFLQHERRNDP